VAIGSSGPIGETFSTRADFADDEALWEWYRKWREFVGPDLLGGYATLHYPKGQHDGMA
jgi:hypothetical protein